MLPLEYTSVLSALFDDMPPAPFPVTQRAMCRELQGPLEDYFTALDVEPIAAASIAQVRGHSSGVHGWESLGLMAAGGHLAVGRCIVNQPQWLLVALPEPGVRCALHYTCPSRVR
jgi:hypothetical protein